MTGDCRCHLGFEQADQSGSLRLIDRQFPESHVSSDIDLHVLECTSCGTRWSVDFRDDGAFVVEKHASEKLRRRTRVKVTKKKKGQAIPGKEWHWNETRWSRDGVHTFENRLVWFTEHANRHAGGGAIGQSFESFLQDGPNVDHAPEHVVRELRTFLKRYFRVEPPRNR